jgi:hypothetical protein
MLENTLNLKHEENFKDEATRHFESLCFMVDNLENDLNEQTARRDTCKKCKYKQSFKLDHGWLKLKLLMFFLKTTNENMLMPIHT